MRVTLNVMILSGFLIGATSCDRPANTYDRRTPEEKTDAAAHQAGEEAYKAAAKAKELTRRAADELKRAGREAREGWEDAKHSDPDMEAHSAHERRR